MKKLLLLALLLVGSITANAQLGTIYRPDLKASNCKTFFVISKKEHTLNVYGITNNDTVLIAKFPVCVGSNPANKTRTGDHATPESGPNVPFTISEINNSSSWKHDFHDGYGNQLAYGPWFLRLKLNGSLAGNRSIGIHGSTGNEGTIPGSKAPLRKGHAQGNDSEGCIRLNDVDINTLKVNYAQIGTKVYILSSTAERSEWEKACIRKAHK